MRMKIKCKRTVVSLGLSFISKHVLWEMEPRVERQVDLK